MLSNKKIIASDERNEVSNEKIITPNERSVTSNERIAIIKGLTAILSDFVIKLHRFMIPIIKK